MSSLDSQSTLAEYKNLIRDRPVAWDAYIRYNLVTEADVKKIKAIDKVSKEKRVDIVEKDGEGYAELVLGPDGVLKKSANGDRVDIVQYMLMWTGDLLDDVPGFADSLLALEQPFDLLLALLDNTRDPIPVLSAAISTTLITVSLASSTNPKNLDPRVKDALPRFYRYLAGVSKSAADHQQQDLAIQSIVALLRSLHGKRAFWELQDVTVQPLVETLEAAAKGTAGSHSGSSDSIAPTSNIAIGASSIMVIVQGGVPLQLLYHVLLVIWQLTFEDTISEEINRSYDLIPPITDILRNSIKEKIARASLAILSNLVSKAPDSNLPALLVTNILPYLQTLSTRFTADSDPELTQDLNCIITALDVFQSSQTTLSSYRIEVMSGHLRWSPPHRNEGFWKKHAREIVEDKELVEKLAEILTVNHDSDPEGNYGNNADATAVAVAANDVGVLVREVPYARKRWESLGVKDQVMKLMGHPDPEVRYEALKAVQGFLQTAFSG